MTEKKLHKSKIAVPVVLICFILQLISMGTAAAGSVLPENLPALQNVDLSREVLSRRDRSAKHFRKTDGSYVALVSIGSLHYKDETGNWCDIETSIVPSDKTEWAYENTENNIKSFFPDNSTSDAGVKIASEKGALRMWMEPSIEWTNDSGERISLTAASSNADVSDNRIIYRPFDFAKCDFIVKADRLEHQIILNELPEGLATGEAYFSYAEHIKLPEGWAFSAETDGEPIYGPIFILNTDGEIVFIFPVPRVYERYDPAEALLPDRTSEDNRYPVYYTLQRTGDRYKLGVNIPRSWLVDPERDFPVIIDPTVDLYSDFNNSTGFSEEPLFGSCCTYHGTGDPWGYGPSIYVGSIASMGYDATERGWAEFNTTSIPDGLSSVDNTVLQIDCSDCNSGGLGCGMSMDTYEMTVQPSVSGAAAIFYDIGTYTRYYGPTTISYNGWYTWDIGGSADTDLYNAISGGTNWFATGFKESYESGAGYEVIFYSHQTVQRPYLTVEYTSGAEPGLWIGVVSTAWNTGGNWSDGSVPTASVDVTIPHATTTPYDPTLSSTAVCKSITIETGGIVNGGSGNLTVYSNWLNDGIFYGASSTVAFVGATDQTINGSGQSNYCNLSNDKTGGKLILGQNIHVLGKLDMLYPGSHTLDTGTFEVDFTP